MTDLRDSVAVIHLRILDHNFPPSEEEPPLGRVNPLYFSRTRGIRITLELDCQESGGADHGIRAISTRVNCPPR